MVDDGSVIEGHAAGITGDLVPSSQDFNCETMRWRWDAFDLLNLVRTPLSTRWLRRKPWCARAT